MILKYSLNQCKDIFDRKSHASAWLSCECVNSLRRNNSKYSPLIQMLDDEFFILRTNNDGTLETLIQRKKLKKLYKGIRVHLTGRIAVSFAGEFKRWKEMSCETRERDEKGCFTKTQNKAIGRTQSPLSISHIKTYRNIAKSIVAH